MRAVERHTLRLIEWARKIVPHFAEKRISKQDARRLAEATSLEPSHAPLSAGAILVPPVRGKHHLLLPASGLHSVEYLFLTIRAIARARVDGESWVPDVFALCAVFPEAAGRGGFESIQEDLQRIKALDPEWFEERLSYLLRMVQTVAKSLARREARALGSGPINPARLRIGFEELPILSEFEGDLGVSLLRAFRSVLVWADAAPDGRVKVINTEVRDSQLARIENLNVGISQAVGEIFRLLDGPKTGPEPVASACLDVAEWAEKAGALQTSLLFAEAAARCLPTRADLAYQAGMRARRNAHYAEAELWLQEAIRLGGNGRDQRSYALSFISLGNLAVQRGNIPEAYQMHMRALRASRRGGLREVRALAFHGLFAIAAQAGNPAEAESFAAQAYRAYGSVNPRLAVLCYDLACFWIFQGQFPRALAVLTVLGPLVSSYQIEILAMVARAAGGAGRTEVFLDAWNRAWDRLRAEAPSPDLNIRAPRVLVDLAHGAASLGDVARASEAAEAAVELAIKSGDARTQFTAESLLDSVRAARTTTAASTRPAELENDLFLANDALWLDLIETLKDLAAQTD